MRTRSRTPATRRGKSKPRPTLSTPSATRKSTNQVKEKSSPADLGHTREQSAAMLIVAMAIAAPLTLWVFGKVEMLRKNHVALGLFGMLVVVVAFALSVYFPRKLGLNHSWLASVLLFVTYTACIDTVLTLALFDSLSTFKFARFYFDEGEKYFKTTAGVFAIGWDGFFHVPLQALVAYRMLVGQPGWKAGALVWAGSVMNSMIPLLMGAATGPFSKEIQVSTALNAPWLVIPVISTIYCMKSTDRKKKRTGGSVPLTIILAKLHFAAIVIHILRALVVLDSQTKAAKWYKDNVEVVGDKSNMSNVQVLQFFFCFVPYHMVSLYDMVAEAIPGKALPLVFTKQGQRADAAFLYLGAYLQGDLLVAFCQLCEWEEFAMQCKLPVTLVNVCIVHAALIGSTLLAAHA